MFVIPKDLRTARLALTAWPHRSKLRTFLPAHSLNLHAHNSKLLPLLLRLPLPLRLLLLVLLLLLLVLLLTFLGHLNFA